MMPATNDKGPDDGRAGRAVGLFLVYVWAVAVEVFLHRRFGERYLGGQAAAVLLLIPLYCLGWQGYNLQPMFQLWVAYLLMCLLHRVDGLVARWRGERGHSYYTGWPHAIWLLRWMNEVTIKRLIEPLLLLGGGYLLRQENAPLGTFLMIGGACLFLSVTLAEQQERARTLDLNDAVIDQQQVAERFRAMRGEQ
jgi:hypothetical protein